MKSHVRKLHRLAALVLEDAAAKCSADLSSRDLDTLRSRVEDEGLSFLTITLPQFCKDFERSLASGGIDPTAFRNFRKAGAIPAFMQGMLGSVFDRETGRMSDVSDRDRLGVCASYVDSVRQVSNTFKKLELACTPEREWRALTEFAQTEHDLSAYSCPDDYRDAFDHVSHLLWAADLRELPLDQLLGRHGPGATAEGISGNQKYHLRRWHQRLDNYYSFLDSVYTCTAVGEEEYEDVEYVPEDQEQPVKVTLVPKTQKSPRVIAIEPVCMQFAQQAVRTLLYRMVEHGKYSAGHVNFRDQGTNRRLALSSSFDGRWATIDLSEASDRVPHELALSMFQSVPYLRGLIDACRSRNARLPNGTLVGPLKKFASMGSALCFPVEAMYFYTSCVVALLESRGLSVTPGNTFACSRDVYVYGDDLIVPSDEADAVLAVLQKYHCKPNASKCFTTGNFRESCGMDAFGGYEVTPTYVRHLPPQDRRHVTELISWISTANSFYKKGYWRTSDYMFRHVERILGPLPYVHEKSAALGRVSYLGYVTAERWNHDLHRLEVKAWTAEPVYRTDTLDGHPALGKSLMMLESRKMSPQRDSLGFESLPTRVPDSSVGLTGRASPDRLHLERTARYGSVALKRRWVPIL